MYVESGAQPRADEGFGIHDELETLRGIVFYYIHINSVVKLGTRTCLKKFLVGTPELFALLLSVIEGYKVIPYFDALGGVLHELPSEF